MFRKKIQKETSCVRQIDSRPFEYFDSSLEYAKNRVIISDAIQIIRIRIYNDFLFKFVLVKKYNDFDIAKTTNKYLKENNLLTEEERKTTQSINIYIIEENSERTKYFAKDNTFLTKKGYQLVTLYNQNDVTLDCYNVFPEHDFNLMKYLRTALYFDLGCYDKEDY